MKRSWSWWGAVSVCAAVVSFSAEARAGLDACNNIEVSASARCQVVAQGGCTVQCEPVHFQAACAGKLEVNCNGQCTAEASIDCTASCQADCSSENLNSATE